MISLLLLYLRLQAATGAPPAQVAAAVLAGAVYRVPPDHLLAIAWHESRFQTSVVTAEPGGRVSCGAMTPVPHHPPCAAWELTVPGSYLSGAAHWATWRTICGGSEWCADLAYGGGRGLVRFCTAGGRHRGCDLHVQFRRFSAAAR